uniref:Unannotated protein n=1 Tax=freshwater metagenome TaxID=449393 RepID=A0A6J7PZA4_9ZZZZ
MGTSTPQLPSNGLPSRPKANVAAPTRIGRISFPPSNMPPLDSLSRNPPANAASRLLRSGTGTYGRRSHGRLGLLSPGKRRKRTAAGSNHTTPIEIELCSTSGRTVVAYAPGSPSINGPNPVQRPSPLNGVGSGLCSDTGGGSRRATATVVLVVGTAGDRPVAAPVSVGAVVVTAVVDGTVVGAATAPAMLGPTAFGSGSPPTLAWFLSNQCRSAQSTSDPMWWSRAHWTVRAAALS